MPDVHENPFTAALLDFFESQQNARNKAPWASETPATWSDGTPIGDVPGWIPEDPYEGFEVSDFYRNRNLGDDNPLSMPVQQRRSPDWDFDGWELKREGSPNNITGWEHDPTIPDIQVEVASPYDGYASSAWLDLEGVGQYPHRYDFALGAYEKGTVDSDYYDSIMESYRRYGNKLPVHLYAPFYESMHEDEFLESIVDNPFSVKQLTDLNIPIVDSTTFAPSTVPSNATLHASQPWKYPSELVDMISHDIPLHASDGLEGILNGTRKAVPAGALAGAGDDMAKLFKKLKNLT